MSFFTRAVVGIALVAGVLHVFRKDVQKIARALQKPAENFVKDVRKELDDGGVAHTIASGTITSSTSAAAKIARSEIAAAAAEAVREMPTTAVPSTAEHESKQQLK